MRLFFFVSIKHIYYWLNREESLKKAKEKYDNKGGRKKASEYYQKNKEAIKKSL